jgi:hypothetical protein
MNTVQAAKADLKQLRVMREWSDECEEVGCALMKAEKSGLKKDTRIFSKMII